MEGDPDEVEEDLSQTPGPSSRKRPADEVLGETPKRPKAGEKNSPRKSMFTKVIFVLFVSIQTQVLFIKIFAHTRI